MKTGRSLKELAAELRRQADNRRDFVAPQSALAMEMGTGGYGEKDYPALVGLNGGAKPVNEHAHGQLASTLGIPKAYYDRCRVEAPGLLCDNVNQWLAKEPAKRRMVRTLDNTVRAVLSDRFRPLDHSDLLEAALPPLVSMKAEIKSCEVTERRMYLKAIFPDLSDPIVSGANGRTSLNIAAVVIQNSEVGASSLRVEAGVFTTHCTNLTIFADSAMRKYHVGRSAVAELDEAVELFTNETRAADDRAFWMKVRDVVAASCNATFFKAQMEKIHAAAGEMIVSENIPAVIEMAARKFAFGEGVKNSVLKHLIQGQDLSKWGLMSAVTAASADVEDYDLATDLEHVGGKILELPKLDWSQIAEAA